MKKNVIVVPDGFKKKEEDSNFVPNPSFVYKEVLDYVSKNYKYDNIYIAPANFFGFEISEQEVGKNYLYNKGLKKVYTNCKVGKKYIDTKGNAVELKNFLKIKKLWPLKKIILVSGYIHAKRAKYCFIREGYEIKKVVKVGYKISNNSEIIPCLWYYKYPLIHRIYEACNIVRYFFHYLIFKKSC